MAIWQPLHGDTHLPLGLTRQQARPEPACHARSWERCTGRKDALLGMLKGTDGHLLQVPGVSVSLRKLVFSSGGF